MAEERISILRSELEQLLKEFVSKYHISPEKLTGLLSGFGFLSFLAATGETKGSVESPSGKMVYVGKCKRTGNPVYKWESARSA